MKLNYFNFKRFGNQILMTNDFGNYLFVSVSDFENLIKGHIEPESDLEKRLLESNMIYAETDLQYSSSKRYDLRRLKGYLNIATSLHIFVVTTACNASCVYCQAKNYSNLHAGFMDLNTAEKAVEIALQSPERFLTFEFQGGEPLLNFDTIKQIVSFAEANKKDHVIKYTIVTNMTLINDDILDFLVEYDFGVSTSLDGPSFLHNKNRPLKGEGDSYGLIVDALNKARSRGLKIGAIQTTTRESLQFPREIVRSYRDLGFDSIFIRPLTPLGEAAANWEYEGYEPEEFVSFYKEVLDELSEINKSNYFLKEEHASILFKRIMGDCVNYMELRSPCGAGVGQLAYYPDGNIFTCDEGRMMHEMGDDSFCLGNVFEHSFKEVISHKTCRAVCSASVLETIPSCCDCAYQPYCGVCPVVSYAQCHDLIDKAPNSYKCRIYSGILDCLFELLLQDSDEALSMLESWGS